MNPNRPAKTIADYMVIAISPVLIMVLVHSVCFFLADIFYRGEGAGGVHWVLFWFVLAVVLIARIGIEQGDGHAQVYGLLLAAATWLYLLRVQPNPVFGALLLGTVWFTAHRITCNCTLVDDEVDASGQGLMQSLRKVPRWIGKLRPNARAAAELPQATATPASTEKASKPSNSSAPGVWLIYFSLAALPVFGLGQTLLPSGDLAARHRGFVDLFCYLAAGLGLLVTTSFLGLRRYLRQRYLVMPGKIALGWIQFGVVGALIVLCASLLLPRPGVGAAWGTLRYQVDHQVRRASQYAARFNPHGQGSGRAGNPSSPDTQPENPGSGSGQASGPNQNANAKEPGNPPGSGPNQAAPAGQPGGEKGESPTPAMPPVVGPLYSLFKLLFYFAVMAGLLWLLYRYRVIIVSTVKAMWAAIRDFIATFLGMFRPAGGELSGPPTKTKLPPFKSFKNPFLTGADRIWPAEHLIAYSYQALQSWALEKEAPASPQTPREFCRRLAEEMPEAAPALERLAFLYGHVAYGASLPANYNPDQLRLIWNCLAAPRQKSSPPVLDAIGG
jgi:hypothetical protein